MQNLPIEIAKRLEKKNDGKPSDLIYLFMKEFHQPYTEIMKMPIPLVVDLLKRHDEEKKAQEKENKKIKKHARRPSHH